MKKLTKLHTILIIVLILVLAGGAYLFSSKGQAESKQPGIQDEITQAMMRLTVANEENDLDTLKQKLAKLQARLRETSEPLFPEDAPSVKIGDVIVDTVDKYDLALLTLVTNADAGTVTIKVDEDSDGNKYSKAEYEVKVRGTIGRINSFIGEIERAEFATLTIEDMEISRIEEEAAELWEAEFTIVTLYQYE